MKKLIFAVLILFVSGCSNTMTPDEMKASELMCKNNGGLKVTKTLFLLNTLTVTAYCNDGSTIKRSFK